MLRKIFVFLCVLFVCNSVFAATYVKPHVTKNGTIVRGHYRSKANKTKLDNYSTIGNINPYKIKKGKVKTNKKY